MRYTALELWWDLRCPSCGDAVRIADFDDPAKCPSCEASVPLPPDLAKYPIGCTAEDRVIEEAWDVEARYFRGASVVTGKGAGPARCPRAECGHPLGDDTVAKICDVRAPTVRCSSCRADFEIRWLGTEGFDERAVAAVRIGEAAPRLEGGGPVVRWCDACPTVMLLDARPTEPKTCECGAKVSFDDETWAKLAAVPGSRPLVVWIERRPLRPRAADSPPVADAPPDLTDEVEDRAELMREALRSLRAYPLAAVGLAIAQLVITGVGVLASSVVAAGVAGIVVWLLAGFVANGRFFFSGLIGALSAIIGTYAVIELTALQSEDPIADASVADISKHPDAKAFEFSDGRVRTDLAGRVTLRSRSSSGGARSGIGGGGGGGNTTTTTTVHQAAPLVSSSWRPGEPIVAWVACVGEECDREEWGEDRRVGVRFADAPVVEDHRKAIAAAVDEHGLVTDLDVPVFRWVASVQAEVARFRLQAWLSYGLAYVLLIAGVIFAWWLKRSDARDG